METSYRRRWDRRRGGLVRRTADLVGRLQGAAILRTRQVSDDDTGAAPGSVQRTQGDYGGGFGMGDGSATRRHLCGGSSDSARDARPRDGDSVVGDERGRIRQGNLDVRGGLSTPRRGQKGGGNGHLYGRDGERAYYRMVRQGVPANALR